MKRIIASLATMGIVVVALFSIPTLADAKGGSGGGGTKSTLGVPYDWPSVAPVPVGEITAISRNPIARSVTIYIKTDRDSITEMASLDRMYAGAGFISAPGCLACRDYQRPTVRVLVDYSNHDQKWGETDLVMTAYQK